MKDLLRAWVVVFKYEFSRRLEEYAKKKAPKSVHWARAARLFFLIQPIKYLICGVDIAVHVVIS